MQFMDEQSKQQRQYERLERRRAAINRHLDHHHRHPDGRRERFNRMIDMKQAMLGGTLDIRQEEIIAAALERLTTEGLNNLSLRDIAKRVNMQAPAFYWHFRNKEVLVDFMAEAILQKEFKILDPIADDENWQDWVTKLMIRLRKAMLAYPDGGRIVAGAHLYPTATLAKIFETTIASLTSKGGDINTAIHLAVTATHYTFGYVIEEQSSPSPEQITKFDENSFKEQYPNLAKAMREAWNKVENADEDYLIGLKYIIKGSEA